MLKLKLVESFWSLGNWSSTSKPHTTAVPTQAREYRESSLCSQWVCFPAFITNTAFRNSVIVSKHLTKAQERQAVIELAAWELLAPTAPVCAPAFPLLHVKGMKSALKVRSARFPLKLPVIHFFFFFFMFT